MIKVTNRVTTKVLIPVMPVNVRNLNFEIFLMRVNGNITTTKIRSIICFYVYQYELASGKQLSSIFFIDPFRIINYTIPTPMFAPIMIIDETILIANFPFSL